MAAKPTKQNVWNTDDLNDTAPNSAKIALGWVLDEAPPSSTFNWILKYLAKVAAYLLDGDLTGNHTIVGLDGSGDFALTVTSGDDGFGINAIARGGDCITAYATAGTGGIAVTGYGNLGGLKGVANAGDAVGVTGQGHNAGAGMLGTGGTTGGVGMFGQGGGGDATGVYGKNTGTAPAVVGESTAGSSGPGMKADSSAGTGVALQVIADLTSPVSAAMRVAPQDAQPSGASNVGDMYITTAGVLKICTVAGTGGAATWVSVGTQT